MAVLRECIPHSVVRVKIHAVQQIARDTKPRANCDVSRKGFYFSISVPCVCCPGGKILSYTCTFAMKDYLIIDK
jgi:hypothetical protein